MSDPLAREHYVWQGDKSQVYIRGTKIKVHWIHDEIRNSWIDLRFNADRDIRLFLAGENTRWRAN